MEEETQQQDSGLIGSNINKTPAYVVAACCDLLSFFAQLSLIGFLFQPFVGWASGLVVGFTMWNVSDGKLISKRTVGSLAGSYLIKLILFVGALPTWIGAVFISTNANVLSKSVGKMITTS